MAELQPVKASLVSDLVDLVNENLGALLTVRLAACPDCGGTGLVGGDADGGAATCPTCKGVGAVERYELDQEKLREPRYGRHIEQFEFKQGQYVPKFRSKDKAFAMLVKLLGFDKAIIELANGATFTEALSTEQRETYVEQLKELAAMGLLDGP
jgi:hypothetical protein